jgi:hypothetical protein
MISLKKEGTAIILPPGQSVRIEDRNDVLNFDTIDPVISWPFNLPTEPNAQAFGFPERIDSTVKTLREYDAEVLLNETPWKTGILKIQKASKSTITANFRGRSGVLTQYKDTPIAELVTAIITYDTIDPAVEIPLFNAAANSPVVFPVIGLQGKTAYHPLNVGSAKMPCFRVAYILKQIFITLGLDYISEVSALGNDFKKWIIFGNKGFTTFPSGDLPATIPVADYLPAITLSDFLKSIRTLDATTESVQNDNNRFTKSSFDKVLTDPLFVDYSDSLHGSPASEEIKKPNISLSFDSADRFVNTDAIEGNYIGELADLAALLVVASPSRDDIHFLLQENAYYKYLYDEVNDELYWAEYASPFQSLVNTDAQALTSKISPCHKRDYYVRTVDAAAAPVISDNAGKVRITYSLPPVSIGFGIEPTFIYMENLTDESVGKYKTGRWYAITGWSFAATVVIDVALDFVDVGTCEVFVKVEQDYFVPIVEGEFGASDLVTMGNSNAPRIAIYHGIQEYRSTTTEYAYSSCDPYNSKGAKIGTEAIRFVQSDSLVKTYWKKAILFMANTRLVTGQFFLDIQQLQAFDVFTKCRINGVDLIIRLLKSIHTTDGLQKQDFEGYKVPE